jgi:hypothetical protein
VDLGDETWDDRFNEQGLEFYWFDMPPYRTCTGLINVHCKTQEQLEPSTAKLLVAYTALSIDKMLTSDIVRIPRRNLLTGLPRTASRKSSPVGPR